MSNIALLVLLYCEWQQKHVRPLLLTQNRCKLWLCAVWCMRPAIGFRMYVVKHVRICATDDDLIGMLPYFDTKCMYYFMGHQASQRHKN